MKNKIIKLAGLAITCMALTACDTEFSNPVGDSSSYSSGDADFSHFVAIGDSLTAGYADAALYLHGQENSYPAILAQQFAKVGGASFKQPLVSDNLGGLLFDNVPIPGFENRLVLNAELDDEGDPLGPEPIVGDPTTEVNGSGLNGTEFNNMGVPGAKSFHLVADGYGNAAGVLAGLANPYFARFSSGPATSMIADAAAQQPSFYVMCIGKNDVLSYATSGGTGTDRTGDSDPGSVAGYDPDDITDPDVFAYYYDLLVKAFIDANPDVKGVLINIPDVSTIPFFTTVPYNAIPLDQATADALNEAYAPYNAGVAAILGATDPDQVAQRTITFTAGQNAVVILDEDLTDLTVVNPPATDELIKMRQATANDLLLLTTSSKIGTLADPDNLNSVWGVGVPLEDSDVLIPSEIDAIDTARTAFNAAIKAEADGDENLVFVDMAAIMKTLSTTGIDYGTGFINATYATGGGFSLDGVHPTARGYAVITNGIIDAINTGFNANIPAVDPGAYTTIFVK